MSFVDLMKKSVSEPIADWLRGVDKSEAELETELKAATAALDEALADGSDAKTIAALRERECVAQLELRRLRVQRARAQERLEEVREQERENRINELYEHGFSLQSDGVAILDQFDE